MIVIFSKSACGRVMQSVGGVRVRVFGRYLSQRNDLLRIHLAWWFTLTLEVNS